jgi:hypothetical protein
MLGAWHHRVCSSIGPRAGNADSVRPHANPVSSPSQPAGAPSRQARPASIPYTARIVQSLLPWWAWGAGRAGRGVAPLIRYRATSFCTLCCWGWATPPSQRGARPAADPVTRPMLHRACCSVSWLGVQLVQSWARPIESTSQADQRECGHLSQPRPVPAESLEWERSDGAVVGLERSDHTVDVRDLTKAARAGCFVGTAPSNPAIRATCR